MELNERGRENVRQGVRDLIRATLGGLLGGALALLLFFLICSYTEPQQPAAPQAVNMKGMV